jgi:hypothetical protein
MAMQRTTIVFICCLTLFVTMQPVRAAPVLLSSEREPTTLAVYPAQVAPAGELRLFGVGLPPAVDVQLSLACP